ncbi:MAG: class I SAM-dependent methyltransferase [Tenacibaculum sp.]|nr:class I SAM-dependent methyltransferase [Tenacibaculum sp.]
MNEKLYHNLKDYLICKDHTVSKETYNVLLNTEFDMLVTQPIPNDLSKYYKSDNYISHTDSKKTLFDKLYHIVKKYTLKQKLNLLNSFRTEEKTVLDIGAGTGDFLLTCKKNNWKIFGVEPSKNAREIAFKKNITLQKDLSHYTNKQFDVITLWHVLEHIPNLIEYINELKKLLKPNGILIIAVPNFKSYDAKHYKEFWAGYDVPRHIWHFSQTSIKKTFSLINMNVTKTIPMKFDSFYVSLLSEKYKSGKNKPISAFLTGLRSNLKAKHSGEYSSLIYIIKNI